MSCCSRGLLRGGAPVEVEGSVAPWRGVALRRGDSTRGCVGRLVRLIVAITSSLLIAYLPRRAVPELFGAGRGVAAGVWAPQGRATRVPDGVVVSGRWAFCSGITHANVLLRVACWTKASGARAAHRAARNLRYLAHARSAWYRQS